MRILLLTFLAAPISMLAASPETCTKATYARLRPPRYPADAIKQHAAGTATVYVLVKADGVPIDVHVDTSSGYAVLDDAAIKTVSEWRFEPARCNGVAIESPVLVPVAFNLSDARGVNAPRWMVIEDEEAIEFASVSEELAYLDGRDDLVRHSMPFGYAVYEKAGPKSWEIVEDPDAPLLVDRRKAVFRLKTVFTEGVYEGRYAYLCEGAPQWCSTVLEHMHAIFQDNPAPPSAPEAARLQSN